MNTDDINRIISKFLDDEASLDEKSFLIEWIKDEKHRSYFEDFVKTEVWVRYNFDASKVEQQLSALSIATRPRRAGVRANVFKYAALLVVLISTSVFIYFQAKQSTTQTLDKNSIVLEINDGSSRYFSLEDHQKFSINDTSIELNEKGILKYLSTSGSDQNVNSYVQHTIHVPFGKTFQVVLADGSYVHLNSGSSLSYPKNFNDSERSVSLVGEGYFDIVKSGIPFQVNTEGLSTEVLGTQFNVSAYNDDAESEVILVEGSVKVFQTKNTIEPITMVPNQKASATDVLKAITIENIDVSRHLGWREGFLVFHNDTISAIIKKLERRFNLNIQNNYEKLNDLNFNGRFKNETLNEILLTIKAHTDFSYSRIHNDIIINEPLEEMTMKAK